MKELTHDLWTVPDTDAIVITTNGFIKKNGAAVMGRGCALEAMKKYPGIEHELGYMISNFGNHVHLINWKYEDIPIALISFPVKHNWWEKADLNLIRQSKDELIELVDKIRFKQVIVPRPGVGFGRLDWETEVKPLLEPYFDDRFIVVHK